MPDSFAASEGLTTLAQLVKNFTGYEKSDMRSASDKTIRFHFIDSIKEVLSFFDGNFDTAGDDGKNVLSKHIDSTQRKLKIICDSLEAPTYLQGQFFLAGNVSAAKLERIYDMELGMLEELHNIKDEISSFPTILTEEVIADHFLHISNFIDDLNQALFEREALIIGDA